MAEAARYRFTVEDYERMGAAGILTKDDRVELVAGEIVRKPMIGPRHAEAVRKCNRTLMLLLVDRAEISPQNPIRMPATQSEPEPDIALLRQRPGGYGRGHPGPPDVLLIADTRGHDLPTGLDALVPRLP